LRKPCSPAGKKRSLLNLWTLVLTALVAFEPIQAAHAYVDPNSAGPLFQFLFPLFVAVASALAACRRILGQLWSRVKSKLRAVVPGGRRSSEIEDPP
jgi:hypothetical protein